MKVAHISQSDLHGGAARAANRLHEGLKCLGVDSHMLVEDQRSDDPSVTALEASGHALQALARRTARKWAHRDMVRYPVDRRPDPEAFHQARTPRAIDWSDALEGFEVINLHWVSGFVDYPDFFSAVSPKQRLVWTLHDMNPFTGGCHYAGDCRGYQAECGQCPALGSERRNDPTLRIRRTKEQALACLRDEQLVVVGPSRWLANEAAASSLLGRFETRNMPYGIDLEAFRPISRDSSREALGLDPEAQVVLFVAETVTHARKGMDLLVSALEHIPEDRRPQLLTVGQGELDLDIPFRKLGFLATAEELSTAYSAADLFVLPSREDNLPNTILESLACGTPVAGFDVGGVPDLVTPGETGGLARPESPESLAGVILDLLAADCGGEDWQARCRDFAEFHLPLERQAKAYRELYEQHPAVTHEHQHAAA